MAVGFDSGDLRPQHFSPKQLKQWLDDIRAHWRNHDWLASNSDNVYRAIRECYLTNGGFPQEGTRALLDISRFMLTRVDYQRWWKLYFEAVLMANKLRDYALLHEINVHFGQAYLLKGDVARARHLFATIISESDDSWQMAEQALLAYIGLIKVETWDYSDRFNEAAIKTALELANRLGDRLLTDLLYQALAGAYAHRQHSERAVGYALTSLGYSFARGDYLQAVMTGIVLASAYRKAGLFDQAQQALVFVHRLAKRVDHPQATALAAYEQGVVEYYRGDYDSSEKWVLRAHNAFEALQWKRQLTMTVHMLGNIALEMAHYETAETRLETALKAWRELDHVYEQASVLYDLGEVNRRWGRRDLALSYLDQSAAVCDEIPPMPSREWLISLIDDCRAKLVDTPDNV